MIGIDWGRIAPMAACGLLLTVGGCVAAVDASPVFSGISRGATLAFEDGFRVGFMNSAFTNFRVFSPSECKGGTIASIGDLIPDPEPRPIWAGKPIILSADTGQVGPFASGASTARPSPSPQMSAPCDSAVMFTPRVGATYVVGQQRGASGCEMVVRVDGQPVGLQVLPSADVPCDRPPQTGA